MGVLADSELTSLFFFVSFALSPLGTVFWNQDFRINSSQVFEE